MFDNKYRHNLPDERMFFFNMKEDENGQPVLGDGDGSENDHLLMCATSK